SLFKEIGEAYSVLSDAEKRRKYDRWGHDWEKIDQAQAAGANFGRSGSGGRGTSYTWTTTPGGGSDGGFNVESEDLGGLCEQLSGRGPTSGRTRVRSTPRRGADMEQPVEITLEEAFAGTQRTYTIHEASGDVRTIEVKIPTGAYDGMRVRIAGKG